MTTSLATLNAGNSTSWAYTTNTACDTWWPSYWPSTYYYNSCVSKNEGEKAFKIAKSLVEKKLIVLKSIKQFIDLVDTILLVLKTP